MTYVLFWANPRGLFQQAVNRHNMLVAQRWAKLHFTLNHRVIHKFIAVKVFRDGKHGFMSAYAYKRWHWMLVDVMQLRDGLPFLWMTQLECHSHCYDVTDDTNTICEMKLLTDWCFRCDSSDGLWRGCDKEGFGTMRHYRTHTHTHMHSRYRHTHPHTRTTATMTTRQLWPYSIPTHPKF